LLAPWYLTPDFVAEKSSADCRDVAGGIGTT
jgi:hypothetical protein